MVFASQKGLEGDFADVKLMGLVQENFYVLLKGCLL